MERNEFLSKFGIGLVAVCAGCSLASCGSTPKSENPTPNNTPTPGSGAVFTTDLNSEITAVGQPKYANGIVLVRIAAGNTTASFTAVQSACTHQGTTINYNTTQGIFICPNHGSEFNTSGAVVLGPAARALQKYTITIVNNILTVSA